MGERLRYLKTFAEHVAVAAASHAARRRPRQHLAGRSSRVLLVSAYPPSHYGTVARFGRWEPHLRRLGWESEIACPSTDAEYAGFESGEPRAVSAYYRACLRRQRSNLRRAADVDVVVLHRGLLPFSPWQRPTFERALARVNPRLVYDFYDAIWLQRQDASRQGSRIGRWLHPPDKIEEIMRLAQVVTVSNEPLAEWARGHHDDVRILPMLIEVDNYEPRQHTARSPVVLGWFGNRHQIPRLLALAPALRRLAASREILLRVITSEPVAMPGVPVESLTHPWSEESERRDLSGLDIGLVPLEDTAHDRGKSPLKLLQFSAAGLAVVASPVASELSILRPGECVLLASDEESWLESLTLLVDDPSLRSRLGAAARDAVRAHYSFESHAGRFVDALTRAAAGAAHHPALRSSSYEAS
jgi:glycosyltransferase involved in cell wall biosynthesis